MSTEPDRSVRIELAEGGYVVRYQRALTQEEKEKEGLGFYGCPEVMRVVTNLDDLQEFLTVYFDRYRTV